MHMHLVVGVLKYVVLPIVHMECLRGTLQNNGAPFPAVFRFRRAARPWRLALDRVDQEAYKCLSK